MIHFMESISQCITAASPARSVWMSFWEMICLARSAQAFSRVLYLHPRFIIFALGKSLLAWKACIGSHGRAGWHWCGWQQQSLFTLCSVDRCGNSKDLSGSTAELTARAARLYIFQELTIMAVYSCPKLSVSRTDLFWRWLLFWQISGLTVTAPCLRSCWRKAASAHGVQQTQ